HAPHPAQCLPPPSSVRSSPILLSRRLLAAPLLRPPPLSRRARLPILFTAKTIFVTDNSPANFSLDHTPFTHPDLFSTSSLAIHGVQSFLDYSLFGDGLPPSPSSPSATPSTPSGTQVRPPPALASTASFCSPLLLLSSTIPSKKYSQNLDDDGRTFNSLATTECGKVFDNGEQQ
ncbi:hypothetical protein V8G54_025907, partial [Vigna mungo]